MEHFNLQTPGNRLSFIKSRLTKAAARSLLLFCLVVISKMGMAQTFPSPSSCTSKDLEIRAASLPVANMCNPPAGDYPLVLSIFNKTGSTRTASALWGTLVVKDINGDEIVSLRRTFFACIGSIAKNTTTTKESSQTIAYVPGQSYEIQNIFLAWTTPNGNEDCNFLENNTANIAPKCGTQDNLKIMQV